MTETPPTAVPAGVAERLEELEPEALRAVARYAEALATAREAESGEDGERESDRPAERDPTRPDDVPANASTTVKTINGNRYRYWQWRDGEKIRSKYIEPVGSDE